ncbi:MAG: DegT/DnrJ/EryC1/StrS family aminotransferase [Desulfobulbaceae bacterium]|nr:MAG: DegT/DnrJ/EryC1/StrS family aminotransferase [Desulfobulbaceae bacterium]
MKVPLLDLQAQLAYLKDELTTAVIRVLESTRYIQGPEVEALEKEVAEYSGVAHGIGVSSGTDALLASLMALGIGNGDKVLTTPYSFFATMGVVLRVGARPVFADIDPVTYNIDPKKMIEVLEADEDRRIRAIIPVHLYGQCADMKAIMAIAEQFQLPVIEDAAQAIGAEYPLATAQGMKNLRAGSMGLCGCFSFFPSKNLGGIGDGGMVVSKDHEFAQRVNLLRNHGAHPKYYHSLVGGNFRLDPIQAAALRVKLPYLDGWHAKRVDNAQRYDRLFHQAGLVEQGHVEPPTAVYRSLDSTSAASHYHIYNQYVIRVSDRDALRDWLLANDIGCEIYYPVALHQQKCLGPDYHGISLPEAEKAAAQTLALPIYPELTTEMQEYVVSTIAGFFAKK